MNEFCDHFLDSRCRCCLLFVVCASCANQTARSKLIGFWQSPDAKKGASIEFTPEGTVVLGGDTDALLDWKAMTIFRDFNLKPPSMKYAVIAKDRIEIQGDFTALLQKGVNVEDPRPKEALTFAISGDELTLSSAKNGKTISFHRSN